MWERMSAAAHRLVPYGLGPLMFMALCAGSVWLFVELADEVVDGETHDIDERIMLAMRTTGDISDPIGPHWIEELGRDITALGSMGVLILLTAAVAGFLLLERKRRTALLLIIAVSSGVLLSTLLKYGFDRPRPDLVPHGTVVYTTSFPSGHAMLSAITYLTLGVLLASAQTQRRVKLYLISMAIVLTVGVGISRVYLGVHWPTDVLAGWTAGAFWALFCWQAAGWLRRRGRIEQEGLEDVARKG